MNSQNSLRLGLILTSIALLAYLLFLLDILFLELRPWPYADGGGWERIILYQSLFWVQYIQHCHFLQPTFLGLIIWKYYVVVLGAGLGLVILKSDKISSYFDRIQFSKQNLIWGGIFIQLLMNSALYFLYASKYKRLSWSLMFPFTLPVYFIFPVILFSLSYWFTYSRGKNSSDLTLLFLIGILIIEFIFSSFSNALLWGCV
ncbi:MAG: hypothetical protein ACFFC7_27980 [Candidatus Hermodarchaeota archaeon]